MPKLKPSFSCSRCSPLHAEFVDLSVDADKQLEILAVLLISIKDAELFQTATLPQLGHAIDTYLQRKAVRESVFMDRSLRGCTLPDIELRAELSRVRAHYRTAFERSRA